MSMSIVSVWDDRRDGIEEGQRVGVGFRLDRLGERWRRQRPGGNDGRSPILRWQAGHFFAPDGDERMIFERSRDGLREADAIDGQRSAGRNLMPVAAGHDERAGQAHFRMQDADRIAFRVVRPEGVRAHEFREPVRMMGFRATHRAHFMQDDGHAAAGDLPGGFGTGEAASDHMDWGGGIGWGIRHGAALA
jgi:hypothetical protein